MCFRVRDGLRDYSVLCHRSHLVQDVGHHLAYTKVSTPHVNHCLINSNSSSFWNSRYVISHLLLFSMSFVLSCFPTVIFVFHSHSLLISVPFFFGMFYLSNSNLQFSVWLCCFPFSPCINLVIRQISSASLDVFPLSFASSGYICNCAGLIGPET